MIHNTDDNDRGEGRLESLSQRLAHLGDQSLDSLELDAGLERLNELASLLTRLAQQQKRERLRLQTIASITTVVNQTLDFDKVSTTALMAVVEMLSSEGRTVVGTLQRVTDDRTELEDIAGIGYKEGREKVPVPLGQGVTGWVAATGQSLLIKDMRDLEWRDIFISVMDQEILSELAVPLLRDGQVWGVLNVESPSLAAFDEDDEQLLTTVGEQILIALHNAEYVELQENLHEEKSRRILAEEWSDLSSTAGGLLHHIGSNLGIIRPHIKEVKVVLASKEEAFTEKEFAGLHDALATIDTNALSTLDLVHALHRAYTGKPPKIESVDVNWLIKRTLSGMGLNDNECTLHLSEQKLEVEADRSRLVEAISELIRNAMKAAPPEGLRLTITSRVHGDYVEVIIKDNGRGLSPDELRRAFQVFYRGKTDKEGFGVGLSGIRKKMQSISGDVLLESEGIGRGATATIRLPTARRKV